MAHLSFPRSYLGSGKLQDKVALITGGVSGIGRAVAIAFAKEGADVAMIYLNEHGDAQETRALVEKEGRRCLALAGDVGDEGFCWQAVHDAMPELGWLDILVNNAANSTHRRASTGLPVSSSSALSARIYSRAST